MPFRGLRLFEVAGFQIRVDASWLFIAALVIWSLYSEVFPRSAPGLDPSTYLAMAVVALVVFFGGLVVHELAHSLMARRFGLKVGGITLFMFGGIAELTEEPSDARSEFWIALAGPAASLVIALVSYLAARGLDGSAALLPARVVLDYLASINLTLAIFNMIPAFPLDGGRVLRAMIWRLTGDVVRATVIAATGGIVFAWVLIIGGLIPLFTSGDTVGLWTVLIGVFLLTLARSSITDITLRRHLHNRSVASLMSADPLTTAPDVTLASLVARMMQPGGRSFLPVVEAGQLVGMIDASAIRRVDQASWPATRVGTVMERTDAANTVGPDEPADAVLRQMARTGRRRMVVARGGQVSGVITLTDLLKHVSLLDELGLRDDPVRPPPSAAAKAH